MISVPLDTIEGPIGLMDETRNAPPLTLSRDDELKETETREKSAFIRAAMVPFWEGNKWQIAIADGKWRAKDSDPDRHWILKSVSNSPAVQNFGFTEVDFKAEFPEYFMAVEPESAL